MSAVTTDPKFVPSARALAVVGLKVGDVRTDEQIESLIKHNLEVQEQSEYQNSVLTYIWRMRGHTNQWIGQRLGFSERHITRLYIEGMAILRTGETTRTVSAIRAASLSETVVQGCTEGLGDSESKVANLEKAALGQHIQKNYVTSEGKEPDTAVLAAALAKAQEATEANSVPATAKAFIDALPTVSESLGVKAKENKRTPQDGGKTAPLTLEANLKKALADCKAIAEAAEAPYVPTPADVKALLDLMSYLQIEVGDEIRAAIDALASF